MSRIDLNGSRSVNSLCRARAYTQVFSQCLMEDQKKRAAPSRPAPRELLHGKGIKDGGPVQCKYDNALEHFHGRKLGEVARSRSRRTSSDRRRVHNGTHQHSSTRRYKKVLPLLQTVQDSGQMKRKRLHQLEIVRYQRHGAPKHKQAQRPRDWGQNLREKPACLTS